MIPVLYRADATDFSTNGIGNMIDAQCCNVTEERNGAYELYMEYKQDGKYVNLIAEEMIIKAKANIDDNSEQLFRIYKISKSTQGIIIIYAVHISYDMSYLPISKPVILLKTAGEAIEQLLNETPIVNAFSAWSDMTEKKNCIINKVLSVRNMLGGTDSSILDTYGGEYEFDNFVIKLHKKRGEDTEKEIKYGKNLVSATMESSIENIITAIYPYATYYTEDSEVVVTLKEGIIYTPNYKKYAIVRCVPVDLTDLIDYDSEITEDMLRTEAAAYAKSGIDIPDVNLRLEIVSLEKSKDFNNIKIIEKIKLCDMVSVLIERLGISVKAKVVKLTYNTLKERVESIEIGNIRQNLAREIAGNERDNDKRISDINKQININKEKIEMRVEKGNVSSQLSMEPDAIALKGNRISIESKKFQLSEEGDITAENIKANSSGSIAGWDITPDGLHKQVKKTFSTMTENDIERMRLIMVGAVQATNEDYKKYDFDGDGYISVADIISAQRLLNGIDPYTQYADVFIKPDSFNETISIVHKTRADCKSAMGVSGTKAKTMSANNIIGNTYITYEDNMQYSGQTEEIVINNYKMKFVSGLLVQCTQTS